MTVLLQIIDIHQDCHYKYKINIMYRENIYFTKYFLSPNLENKNKLKKMFHNKIVEKML